MRYPKKLMPGDTIGLVCPSSPVTAKEAEKAVRTLTAMGYRTKTAGNVTEHYGGYMAGDAETRAYWVNHMFEDPEVDAVICMRGGDGITRSAALIDRDIIRKNPKVFVGYSDITILHLIMNQECDLVTFHGPMAVSNMIRGLGDDELKAFSGCVSGDNSYRFGNPRGYRIHVIRDGAAEGVITGGNLSLLSASIGTPYEVDTDGKILFMEEVTDPVYRVGKMAMQMKNAGKFDHVKGILLGQFTDCATLGDRKYDAEACLKDILSDINVPVMSNLQSGHGAKMITLPLGTNCYMNTENKEIRFDISDRAE